MSKTEDSGTEQLEYAFAKLSAVVDAALVKYRAVKANNDELIAACNIALAALACPQAFDIERVRRIIAAAMKAGEQP